jgi:predicted metalloprotease with PDZ domain
MRILWLTLMACAACCTGAAQSAPDVRAVSLAGPSSAALKCDIKLTPLPAKAGDESGDESIGSVDIDLTFETVRLAAGDPLLRLALVADNVDTVSTTLTNLEARDSKGPLPLTSRDVDVPVEAARDSETGGPTREWFSDRTPEGSVTIHYTVPAMATLPPRGAAPPTAFRNDADGVSAAGNTFLLVPPGDERYAVITHWDLSRLKAGAAGATSLGKGSAISTAPMSSAELRQSYFMGGAIHRWPAGEGSTAFFSAWQGTPSFDAASLMSWTQTLHQHYLRFFRQPTDQPYGVFLRFNPVNGGGGTGFFHSFVLTYGSGVGADVDWLKITLAHEMFHTFQPYISVPAGKESSWFAEGLAVLYEGKLPLRYGLITPEAFLKNLNFTASRYYSDVMARLPNSEIAAQFWEDTRIRTLAYDRAMLYFAVVDDAVRKKSHGKRSLDDLLLQMLALEKRGKALSNSDWESVLRAQLGEGAVTQFRESLAGQMPIPASDAFGPCFARTTAYVRRYELGFSPGVLTEPKRIVRGLIPGSAAESAGLQNGDEIIHPVPQDEIQGNQSEWLKLDIRRNGKEIPLTYLPRGQEVEVYQWIRVPGRPDPQCGL